MNPFEKFENWFSKEKEKSNLRLPAACCLSTVGLDGYPNARFVSLKEIVNESFVITGSLNSRKGQELQNCSKAAITFWWTSTERQIRIQGDVLSISESEAKHYFSQRNRDSQIVSSIFEQGKKMESIAALQEYFAVQKKQLGDAEIICPKDWSGIYLLPLRIEFMEFKKSRLHERMLYQKINNNWEVKILQP